MKKIRVRLNVGLASLCRCEVHREIEIEVGDEYDADSEIEEYLQDYVNNQIESSFEILEEEYVFDEEDLD